MSENSYDIVLVGSGLGALLCAVILGKHGYRVCVLEKNRQYGGCLQSFARGKQVFDSGVHYIGSLAPGETLHQVFKYAEIMDDLPLEKMDEAVFDRIVFLDDNESYDQAQGYANFADTLIRQFPEEADAIHRYCEKLQLICRHFAYYQLRPGQGLQEKQPVLGIPLKAYLESLTSNTRLQEVLAGNGLLYAGEGDITPFYVHALIMNSYIESAWKCVDGGAQITRLLLKTIRRYGGTLFNRSEVVSLEEKDGLICAAVLRNGKRIEGKKFISNLHPQRTIQLTTSRLLRPLYRQRITAMRNTTSSFCAYLTLKPGAIRYEKANYYLHTTNGVWEAVHCDPKAWPQTVFVFFGASSQQSDCATTVILMAYMPYNWMQPWANSFNTDAEPGDRGETYAAFKREMEQKLIAVAAISRICLRLFIPSAAQPRSRTAIYRHGRRLPLRHCQKCSRTRQQLCGGSYQGSEFVPYRPEPPDARAAGVAIGALQTCSEFVDPTELLEKIRHA
ncbi:MAG: NAD(P)-binding protein [Flavihumibacter sp.]